MSTPEPSPADLLAELLETLPPADRQKVTAWLLGQGRSGWPRTLLSGPEIGHARLASQLTTGEESQLITIRLPADRHTQLRTWCTGHGFSMAAVVRGLVERFLDEQVGKPAADA
jgi:hypothetical protein